MKNIIKEILSSICDLFKSPKRKRIKFTYQKHKNADEWLYTNILNITTITCFGKTKTIIVYYYNKNTISIETFKTDNIAMFFEYMELIRYLANLV